MIAWGKLNGNIKKRFLLIPGQQFVNIAILLAILGLSVYLVMTFSPENAYLFYVIFDYLRFTDYFLYSQLVVQICLL